MKAFEPSATAGGRGPFKSWVDLILRSPLDYDLSVPGTFKVWSVSLHLCQLFFFQMSAVEYRGCNLVGGIMLSGRKCNTDYWLVVGRMYYLT